MTYTMQTVTIPHTSSKDTAMMFEECKILAYILDGRALEVPQSIGPDPGSGNTIVLINTLYNYVATKLFIIQFLNRIYFKIWAYQHYESILCRVHGLCSHFSLQLSLVRPLPIGGGLF